MSLAFSNCKWPWPMKRFEKMHHKASHGKNTEDGGYIPSRLSLCPGALLIVTAKAILNGNRLLHSLKWMLGSYRTTICICCCCCWWWWWWSTVQKQRVNKEQNFEMGSPLSIRDQGKHVSFSWPQLEAALSVFKVSLCLLNFFIRN